MNLAILGGFNRVPFASGWTKETAVAFLGGGELDLTTTAGAPDARLTAIAVLGSVEVLVPQGSQVSMSGMSLLGARESRVSSGDGPRLAIRGVAVLGSVEVKESPVLVAA